MCLCVCLRERKGNRKSYFGRIDILAALEMRRDWMDSEGQYVPSAPSAGQIMSCSTQHCHCPPYQQGGASPLHSTLKKPNDTQALRATS